MKVEKLETKEPSLETEKINELFRSIVMGEDVTEIIKTKRGDFKVKFPRQRDLENIARLTAFRLNGIPASCFDAYSYNIMQQIATLDVVVISGPAWFELAKKENNNFSWRDIPSLPLIQEVYARAYEFRQKVQEQIERDTNTADREMANNESSNDHTEPGLFDGLSCT